MPFRPRVKVCCIQDPDEAAAAVAAGAFALGLVSAMPSGPGVIPESTIARIVATLPAGIATFLLTSGTDADAIAAQHRRCGTNTLQLCDHLPARVHLRLRQQLPGIPLVQVVHMPAPGAFEYAIDAAPRVDALLLDSGRPDAAVRELGGTGRTHDWTLSRRLREAVALPVFLAGGLTPDNVAGALDAVAPYGLDLCSGVRTAGRLDRGKLAAFFRALPPETDEPRGGSHRGS